MGSRARALRQVAKVPLLFGILLLHVPLTVLSLGLLLLPRRRTPAGIEPLLVVTPFEPGDSSGGAKAIKDLLELLRARVRFRVLAASALTPGRHRLTLWAAHALAWPLPVPPHSRSLLLGSREVQAAIAGHATILFEFLSPALVLWIRSRPSAHVVIRDHEVIARKIAMEYRRATGAEAAVHALRFVACYLISLCVYLRADRIVALTAEDQQWLLRWFPSMRHRARFVPVAFVDEHPLPSAAPRSSARDLLMVANFFHSPNVDAVRWFLRECVPYLDPGFTLHLCGLDKPLDEVDFSGNLAVVRHGFVADVMKAAPDAAIAVAPVVSGGGVRIKNLLLASMRKVVVTTPLGNEGIGFLDGRDAIVAGSGREMAARINEIARSPADRYRLAEAGRACVLAKFGSASILERFLREALARDDDGYDAQTSCDSVGAE